MLPTELEDVLCPLGCARNDEIILSGRDLIHNLPGLFHVVKCCGCGLMRTNPRPTPDSIGFYYPDDYGPYLGTRVSRPESSSRLKRLLTPLVRRTFNDYSQRLPLMTPTKMLEIGCASGSFLHQMSGLGWKVEGIEFSVRAARAAQQLGYSIHGGSLETAPTPASSFDLIVGWMVLEHLHNPVACLKKLHEWSNPDARLVLSVPNSLPLWFSLFNDKWYGLHLPNHLYHYVPETLEKVLLAGGWRLEKVHHQRSVISLLASTANVVESKGWRGLAKFLRHLCGGGKWFYILFPIASIFSAFGYTGRMTVWARRNIVQH